MRSKQLRNFGQGGFSLIEILVALVIMIVIVVGMAALFDKSAKVTKTENSITDAQQSLRYGSYQLVRELRMAGAGGLPGSTSVTTIHQLAVSLNLGSTFWGVTAPFDSNNVNSSSDTVYIGGTHHVRKGTDILHIRGVISNALYDIAPSAWTPPSSGTVGTLVIQPCTRYADPTAASTTACYPNGANDMSLFTSSTSYPYGRLFVMSDALGNIGVGLIGSAATDVVVSTSTRNSLTVYTATLQIDIGNSGSQNGVYSQTLCPNGLFPAGLVTPSRGGVLDDRVFFIDDGTTTAANCNLALGGVAETSRTIQAQVPGPCHPVLSYADWAPGDTSAAPFSTATVTQIAEDIEDLQVAYGVDFYDLTTSAGCGAYPSNGTSCSLTNPAPTRTSSVTGALLDYPSDASLSITSRTAFNTLVSSLQGSTSPNTDSTEDTSAAGHDEWVGNVSGEIVSGTFDRTSDLSRLKAIEVSILAKGSNPDPSGRVSGTTATPAYLGAFQWPLMDSGASTVSQPTQGTAFPFRRRASTVRVNLRNFQLQ